jgi:hypothetical protein
MVCWYKVIIVIVEELRMLLEDIKGSLYPDLEKVPKETRAKSGK